MKQLPVYMMTTSPENRPSEEDRDHPTRREFLGLAVSGLIVAAGAALAKTLRNAESAEKTPGRKPEASESVKITPERRVWATGELTENKVQSFMTAFSQLDRNHIVLLDQNGNVVDGRPLKIPLAILALEGTGIFERMFQVWLNAKRNDLKQKYPTLYFSTAKNREEPTLLSVRTSIPSGEKSLSQIVFENSRLPVSPRNKIPRHEYVKEEMKKSGVPDALAGLFIGACATESQFTEIGQNDIGASGPWQIMPDIGREYGLIGSRKISVLKTVKQRIFQWIGRGRKRKRVPRIISRKKRITVLQPFDDRNDFEKATPAAVKILRAIYEDLRRDPVFINIQALYGVSEEDFLSPAVINSYQAGPARIKKMCAWFLENYPPAKVKEILGAGPYGKDLYTLMTSVYVQSNQDPRFGKQSRDYVIRAMAMSELFAYHAEDKEPEFAFAYQPPEPDTEPENLIRKTIKAISADTKSHLETLGVGLGAGIAAAAAGKAIDNRSFSRRDFLIGTLGLAAAYAGRKLGKTPERPAEKTIEARKVPENPFSPFTLDEAGVQKELLQIGSLDINTLSLKEIRKLRDRVEIGLDAARAAGLPRFESADDIKKPLKIKHLAQYSSAAYRLRGVGMLNDASIDNDNRYTYCYEHTARVIEEIDRRLNEALRKEGFPKHLHVRLIIKGLTRSEIFQKSLRSRNPYAARGDSPHMYGHTFDIHRAKYDVIDSRGEGKSFCMVSTSASDPVNDELRLPSKISAVLGRVLIDMKAEGKISVIHEGANPVYHVSDLQPLG